METDIIIPARNNAPTLPRVLTALQEQVSPRDHVMVVDDGSTDSTPDVLAAARRVWGDRLHGLRQAAAGPAAARNAGVAAGQSPLLVFLGADCIPQPRWLARHQAVHRRFPEETVGCVGWVSWDPTIPPTPLMVWAEHGGDQNAFGLLAGQEWVSPRHATYGANLSLKRSFFAPAGGYDAVRFPAYGWEDLELGLRLERQGFRLRFEPSARVWHAHRYPAAEVRSRAVSVGRGFSALQALHPEVGALPLPHGRNRLLGAVARGVGLDRAAWFLAARTADRWVLPTLYRVACRFSFLEGLREGGQLARSGVDKLSTNSVRFSITQYKRFLAFVSLEKTIGRWSSTEDPQVFSKCVHNLVHTIDGPLDGGDGGRAPSSLLQDVAVVVLHYGDPVRTRGMLGMLRRLYPDPGAPRVFLVENEPFPDSLPASAAERVGLPENAGYARANNVGLRIAFQSGARLVVLFNNDVEAAPGILEALRREADAPGIGVVGATVLEPEGRVAGGGRVVWWRFQARLARAPVPAERLDFLHGACLGVTKACWEKVGPIPEDLFLYWEDVAYGLRVRAAGFRFAVVASPVLRHERTRTRDGRADDKTYYLVRNALHVVRAYGPPGARRWARVTLPLRLAAARVRGRAAVAAALGDARAGRLGRRPGMLPAPEPSPVAAAAVRVR